MRFTDIRARITEGMKFKEYIMWVSETDKPGVYAYEEVQPLVRCKDCKWNKAALCGDGTSDCAFFGVNLTPDDIERGFCAWGERVEGSE